MAPGAAAGLMDLLAEEMSRSATHPELMQGFWKGVLYVDDLQVKEKVIAWLVYSAVRGPSGRATQLTLLWSDTKALGPAIFGSTGCEARPSEAPMSLGTTSPPCRAS